jgi:tRNA U34 5-carboxymethylaminomethyl modifying GTPase MnmE/TrmE
MSRLSHVKGTVFISNRPVDISKLFLLSVRIFQHLFVRHNFLLLKFLAPGDIVIAAEELRYAAQAIGRVTGDIGVEDILDALFKDFCIGK